MNLHAKVSFVKSFIRIAACCPILFNFEFGLYSLVIGLIIAEIFGIVEEIGELK